jgi:hypothetical protein
LPLSGSSSSADDEDDEDDELSAGAVDEPMEGSGGLPLVDASAPVDASPLDSEVAAVTPSAGSGATEGPHPAYNHTNKLLYPFTMSL